MGSTLTTIALICIGLTVLGVVFNLGKNLIKFLFIPAIVYLIYTHMTEIMLIFNTTEKLN